jgi:hypothetical protein
MHDRPVSMHPVLHHIFRADLGGDDANEGVNGHHIAHPAAEPPPEPIKVLRGKGHFLK